MTELTIDQALQQGIEAHKAGQVQDADRLYTAILKAQPKHPDANHNMGVLAVGIGKVQEALPFFKTALDANPATAQFWLSYIDTLIKLDRLADAKAVLDQAKSKDAKGDSFDQLEKRLKGIDEKPLVIGETATEIPPEPRNIMDSLELDQAINLTKKKVTKGNPEEANLIYQDIFTKPSKNEWASDGLKGLADRTVVKSSKAQHPSKDQLQSLINLNSRGQLKRALKDAETLVKKFPKSPLLFNIQGVVLKGLGQIDQSIEAYYKALAIKPDYADAYNNIGNALKEQGKLKEAIEAYKKALGIKPDYAEAFNNMGNALKEQGKLNEAIKAYKNALTIKPDSANAYYKIGNALQEQGKLDEAIEAYNKAIAIKPDFTEAYDNMGNALQEQGKLKEAIGTYNKAIAIKPDSTGSYYNMGNALKEQGKLNEAIKAYHKAIAIKPDFAEAYNNMGDALQEQGKLKEAIGTYNKAIAIKPDYAEVYNNVGNAQKKQGKLDAAIESYNKAIVIIPDNAEVYYNMGLSLQEQGNLNEAIEAYNKAIAIKPDHTEAARSLVELPIGSIDAKIILGLNKQFSVLCSKIEDQSTRRFFEANLLSHNRKYNDAFKVFVEANRIKANDIASSVKYLVKRYDKVSERIQRWSPVLEGKDDSSIKKLFILGPSRSGKSSLEQLLVGIPKVYPQFEYINLKTLCEIDVRRADRSNLNMAEIFYHNETALLADKNNLITSTSPDSIFNIDRLLDGLGNSFFVLVKRDQTDIASEIFKTEYRKGNLYSYANSSIQEYLNAYTAIWEEVKSKAPQSTLEINYEDILMKPEKTVKKIGKFTALNLQMNEKLQYPIRKLSSPFREHYALKFKN